MLATWRTTWTRGTLDTLATRHEQVSRTLTGAADHLTESKAHVSRSYELLDVSNERLSQSERLVGGWQLR